LFRYLINSKQDVGKKGEDIAVSFLKDKGYKIIDRNFRIRGGEVDIVAIDQNVLVFIEVKTCKSSQSGTPFEAISSWKLHALIKTAQFYKYTHHGLPESMRIDAVSVVLAKDNTISSLELVKNISL
jgi:putative endonuclease